MIHDFGIGIENKHPRESIDVLHESAIIIDRTKDLQTVVHAGDIVVLAMSWCCVHAPGALIERHIISQNQKRFALDEWVTSLSPFQRLPPKTRYGLGIIPAAFV